MKILKSADSTLRGYVIEMFQKDGRFVGMGSYVFDIKFYWSSEIDTACAGHGFIFFNPEFWDKLDSEEKRKSIIAHEVWHLILNHLVRGKGYDHETYNIAADHVINLGLQEDGFVMNDYEMFGGIKLYCAVKYRGWSTERIYADILKKRKDAAAKGKGIPKEAGGEGGPSQPTEEQIDDLIQDVIDGEAEGEEPSSKTIEKIKEENAEKAEEAADNGKGPQATSGKYGSGIGSGKGGQDRILKATFEIKMKKAEYEDIFEDYLTEPLSSGKRTYLRPARRQMAGGLRLKGRLKKQGIRNRLTHLVYALDVSGSITSKQADQFLSSAASIKKLLNPRLMTVILWDTAIKFEKTFREDEPLDNIRVRGGGGTKLEPVYSRVKALNPEALVVFTDFQVSIPPKPDCEVIWFGTDTGNQIQHVHYGDVYLIPEK